jgi:microcompartment protein CcmK/EutM
MAQQAAYVADNYSVGSSANNHFIGEVAALAVFGKMWPGCRFAARWGQFGFEAAERECLRQIFADGVSKEQSFGYFVFIWEFYLHLKLAGYRLSAEVVRRLDASVRFIDAVCASSGFVPQVGDEDDGAVLGYLGVGWPRYHTVASVMHEALGTAPLERPRDGLLQPIQTFPEGGYTVCRAGEPEMLATFDHGPLGFGSIAAHGHADALSVTLTVGGQPVLVDPGAYCYHDKPDWRAYFRSTAAHNTICFDGVDQSEDLGPFLWGRRAEVRPVPGKADAFVVSTPQYAGTHERQVQLAGSRLVVTDAVAGAHGEAKAHWHLHPDVEAAKQGDHTVLLSLPSGARLKMSFEFQPVDVAIVAPDQATPEPGPGWFSPAHGQLVASSTVAVTLPAAPPEPMRTVVEPA